MKTTQDWLGDDAMTVRNPRLLQYRRDRRAVGNARPEARVRTPAIVVSHPLEEHAPRMAFAKRNHKVETLSTNRANQPFAERVRLGARMGVLTTVRPIDSSVRSTPSE
jgi:hypothetical protein